MLPLFIQNNLFFLYFMFLFAVKAINEYASRKSKAAESNAETTNVDARLEEIVERMLNKYVKDNLSCLILFVVLSLLLCLHIGVLRKGKPTKPWELQLNVEDWTNFIKQ